LNLQIPTWGGVVSDFNNDGLADIFINLHDQAQPMLMLNSPNHVFSAATDELPLRDRHNCSAADVNLDGSMDLMCAIGDNKGTSATPDELTLSLADNGGQWASDQFGVMDAYGRGRNAVFLNLNGDEYPDLYIVNESSRSDGMLSSNRLYINDGGTRFVSASSWGVDLSNGGACADGADLNGDGRDDLLLCSTGPSGSTTGLRAYINTGSGFSEQAAALGLVVNGVNDVAVADFNKDGKPDIAELTATGLDVMLNTGNGYVAGYTLAFNGGADLATGDANGDGYPDIYVLRQTQGNTGDLMLINGGDGTSFTSMQIPEPGAGRADDVLAIDYDHNGLTDFITLNGWLDVHGPVQLTAFFPD